MTNQKLPDRGAPSTRTDVDAFLRKVAATPAGRRQGTRGRLIFALDATASRQPTWDRACHIQAEMFAETEILGGIDVQLVFYRGFRECRASPWVSEAATLSRKMTSVACLAGRTQINRVLRHAMSEAQASKVSAMVFVGDAFEEEIDTVCDTAGHLGLLGVPVFLFHEGRDPLARTAFQEIARLTSGACCSFDAGSASQLRELLRAVAVFAAGGRRALDDYGRRHGGEAGRLAASLTALPRR